MRPADVLAHQMDLLSRLDDVRVKAVIASAYSFDQGLDFAPDARARQTMLDNGERMVDVLHSQVRTAYAYRVTEDMTTMVQHAADGLDDLDQWDRSLAPTGAGLVRFDKPLLIKDVRGETLKVHWVVWGPAPTTSGVGTALSYFNDARDPDDAGAAYENDPTIGPVRDSMGVWRWVGSDLLYDEARLGPAAAPPTGVHAMHLAAQGVEPEVLATKPHRFVHALWLLLGQTITAVEQEPVERQARRKAERMRIPAQVTVIRLRRTEYSARGDGESQIEWQHRWVVRGHWAWRQCGPEKPGAVRYEGGHRRRIFVPPYIKGPEGKRLVVTDKVYQLQR